MEIPPNIRKKKTERYSKSRSIYKLALLDYPALEKEQIWYNPFFTKFLEDVVFNEQISLGKSIQDTHLYLRFAHQTHVSNPDFEDCLIKDPGQLTKAKSVPPMFLFYIKYLFEVYPNLDVHKPANVVDPKNSFPINMNNAGKYGFYHFMAVVFYLYFLKLIQNPDFAKIMEKFIYESERQIQPIL